jgi:hypothetical protein
MIAVITYHLKDDFDSLTSIYWGNYGGPKRPE